MSIALERQPQNLRMYTTPRPGSLNVHTLDPKQGDLAVLSPRVSAQLSVAQDHPVARHDDGERIGPHGLADGPGRTRISQLVGDISVRGGCDRTGCG